MTDKETAQTRPPVTVGLTTSDGFELAQRAAKMMSTSTLVPKEYQGNQGFSNCIIALNMAARMGADPLMVCQNLVVVHGKPTWSSQFLIATFNNSGRFSALRYEFSGKPGTDGHGCRAWAIEKSTEEKLTGATITIDLAKKEGWYGRTGSKWPTMPEQMLMYRSAAWLVRAYAPELSMGLHTKEEIMDAFDCKESSNGGIIDVMPNAVDLNGVISGKQPAATDWGQPVGDAQSQEEAARIEASMPDGEADRHRQETVGRVGILGPRP
jgi:hypothetical protein